MKKWLKKSIAVLACAPFLLNFVLPVQANSQMSVENNCQVYVSDTDFNKNINFDNKINSIELKNKQKLEKTREMPKLRQLENGQILWLKDILPDVSVRYKVLENGLLG